MASRKVGPRWGGSPGAIFRFDPTEHRYWLGDEEVPGFTAICRDMGISETNPFYTEEGREEGIALHKWLIFLASGRESKKAPDERIAGRVEGIRKFLRETRFQFAGGEKPLLVEATRWACTPDLWGSIGGRSCLIEAKRGKKMPYHRLQTAAQQIALRANDWKVIDRIALYLKDGGYNLEKHDDLADEYRWLSVVAGYWAKKHYAGGVNGK